MFFNVLCLLLWLPILRKPLPPQPFAGLLPKAVRRACRGWMHAAKIQKKSLPATVFNIFCIHTPCEAVPLHFQPTASAFVKSGFSHRKKPLITW